MKCISLLKHLFRAYALVFLLFFFIIALVSITFMAYTIDANIIETQKLTTNAITQSIDNYFSRMDEFSRTLMASEAFKEAVITDIPEALDAGYTQTDALREAYMAAYQMFERGYRVGVATKGLYIWLADRILVQPLEEDPRLYDDYQGYGRPLLRSASCNAYLQQMKNGSESQYISTPVVTLARSINLNNQFYIPQAMLEVHIDQSEFSAYLDALIGDTGADKLQISVYGTDGSLLYGQVAFTSLPAEIRTGQNTQWTQNGANKVRLDSFSGGKAYIYYQIPDAIYYQRLMIFLAIASAFFLAMMGVMVLTTYSVSKKITRPISQLSTQLEQLCLEHPAHLPKIKTSIHELNTIAQVVADMDSKLTSSMQEIVMAHTSALQSQLMALQSQMQPHFLYNTLAVIGNLSDQGNAKAVSRMCQSLSQMLRYVSAKEDNGVFLYEEISFLKNYTTIMSERFPQARVHLNIPLDMMDLRVPKLILQPLCENSFKYVPRGDIEIWITGEIRGDMWQVNIRDNGNGLSRERIAQILDRCQSLFQARQSLAAQISGMGLVNIYARLALYYQSQFLFQLDTRAGITIGGSIHAAEV